MVASLLDPAPPSSPQPLEKIVLSRLLPQRLLHYAMQQVNQRSSIAAKEIFESASLLPNVYLDFATLCPSEHR
jgi:hypothetical protein